MEIPVYLFTGFLEAGKTQFIQETFENEEFNIDEKTLIIICEEGIEEYDKEKFKVSNVAFDYIEDEEDCNVKTLQKLQKKHKAGRIIIEYNGMWQLDTIYSSLPKDWSVYQEIFTADSTTFVNMNQNMRSLVVDKLKSCELVMFNRVDVTCDINELHKIVRAVSKRTNIAYEYTDGHIEEDTIEDPLPFDLNQDIVEVKDEDYAIWYRTLGEETPKFIGKKFKIKGICGRDKQLSAKEFVFGRHVMTCCEADIAFQGLICKTKEETKIKNKEWVTVVAKLVIANHVVYKGEGPVLVVESFETAEKPRQEVATFY